MGGPRRRTEQDQALVHGISGDCNVSLMGNPISAPIRSCRFVKDRCIFIGWDGKVSACSGLLHTHKTYFNGLERTVSAYTVGDVGSAGLNDIWNSDEYERFWEKVRDFSFAPCHVCGGNTFPACGGCLWATGSFNVPDWTHSFPDGRYQQ